MTKERIGKTDKAIVSLRVDKKLFDRIARVHSKKMDVMGVRFPLSALLEAFIITAMSIEEGTWPDDPAKKGVKK